MPAPLAVRLSQDQAQELERLRDRNPKPHVRERAAAVRKVAAGWSSAGSPRRGCSGPAAVSRRRSGSAATWPRGRRGGGCGRGAGASPPFPPCRR